MTKYHCIFRESEDLCWASAAPWDSEAQARSHATYFSFELIGLFAVKTGICPPVGMRADETSHYWLPKWREVRNGYSLEYTLEPRS